MKDRKSTHTMMTKGIAAWIATAALSVAAAWAGPVCADAYAQAKSHVQQNR